MTEATRTYSPTMKSRRPVEPLEAEQRLQVPYKAAIKEREF